MPVTVGHSCAPDLLHGIKQIILHLSSLLRSVWGVGFFQRYHHDLDFQVLLQYI